MTKNMLYTDRKNSFTQTNFFKYFFDPWLVKSTDIESTDMEGQLLSEE